VRDEKEERVREERWKRETEKERESKRETERKRERGREREKKKEQEKEQKKKNNNKKTKKKRERERGSNVIKCSLLQHEQVPRDCPADPELPRRLQPMRRAPVRASRPPSRHGLLNCVYNCICTCV
jgi:hypothetical protein